MDLLPLDQRSVGQLAARHTGPSATGHDAIPRPRSSSPASSSERTVGLEESPQSFSSFSSLEASPALQNQSTLPLPAPPRLVDVPFWRPPFDARRRCRSTSSTDTTPEFSSTPCSGTVYEDQLGVGAVRDRTQTTSFETPSSKLERLIAQHQETRRKWESPCPVLAEAPSTSTGGWRPSNMAPRPSVVEKRIASNEAACVTSSPFSSQQNPLPPAEAMAISPVLPPRVLVSHAVGSGSHATAPAAATVTSFPRHT